MSWKSKFAWQNWDAFQSPPQKQKWPENLKTRDVSTESTTTPKHLSYALQISRLPNLQIEKSTNWTTRLKFKNRNRGKIPSRPQNRILEISWNITNNLKLKFDPQKYCKSITVT